MLLRHRTNTVTVHTIEIQQKKESGTNTLYIALCTLLSADEQCESIYYMRSRSSLGAV